MPSKKKVKFEGITYEGKIEELIIQALIEKQGADIQCIDLKKINHVYFDYFIVCTGNSKPHVETLCDYVQEQTQRVANLKPVHVEGLENKEWVLLDYFNVLVHIFQPEAREYYNIEALWNDADIQKF
ncbi:MAG: ribosome silencing factor [Bacteroidales bacterium]|nr:ribosome silencing factor [Bacteroidales bacterium]MBO7648203.1 ribosome silencing factor [Bacteroidales bacterium]MCR4856650.1 ribosome silencing factor [Bacteroidales bacterium]